MKDDAVARRKRISPERLARITPKIRALYATGNYTQAQIGDRFGICGTTVATLVPSKRKSKKGYSMMCDGVIEEWKTGDHSLRQLAERWDCSRRSVRIALKKRGVSANNQQHRNRRIGELYAAGRSAKMLAEHYGITEEYAQRIAWNGGGREDQRLCLACGKPFTPKDNRHRCCDTNCSSKNKRLQNTCSVCGKTFPTQRADQALCGDYCRRALQKIKTIEDSLMLRELQRQGYTYAQIAEVSDMTQSSLTNVLTNTRRAAYLKAIETVRRHRGKAWLSGLAKLELKRARAVLKSEGLDRYA